MMRGMHALLGSAVQLAPAIALGFALGLLAWLALWWPA